MDTKSFFENIFADIIKESNNILIEYKHTMKYFKEDSFIDFQIITVSGCENDYDFKKRLQNSIKESLKELRNRITKIPKEDQIFLLDSIKDELHDLIHIVDDETLVYEESEYGDRQEYNFKTFFNPIFKGTQDAKINHYKLSIKRLVEDYAKVWLEVIGEAKYKIDFLINQIDLFSDKIIKEEILKEHYVDIDRIKELQNIKTNNYDLTRLIYKCKELNDAASNGNHYSVILLVRSIIDHIPPIFNKKSFNEVANNHGSKSFKGNMDRLNNSLRKIADSGLHQQIRKKETLLNETQVNFSNDLDVLLAEIVRVLK